MSATQRDRRPVRRRIAYLTFFILAVCTPLTLFWTRKPFQTASLIEFMIQNYVTEELERLQLPSRGMGVVVMEDHGEAFSPWMAAIKTGLCPAHSLAVVHVDKHFDMALPRRLVSTVAMAHAAGPVLHSHACPPV